MKKRFLLLSIIFLLSLVLAACNILVDPAPDFQNQAFIIQNYSS